MSECITEFLTLATGGSMPSKMAPTIDSDLPQSLSASACAAVQAETDQALISAVFTPFLEAGLMTGVRNDPGRDLEGSLEVGAAGQNSDGASITLCVSTTQVRPPKLSIFGAERIPKYVLDALGAIVACNLDRIHLAQQSVRLNEQAERRINEVSTIYEIGKAIDSVGIDALLEFITEKAAKVMDAQACSLMRLKPDTNALTIAASYGLAEDVVIVTERALGEGIAGRVAQTGEPMLIVEADKDPRLTGVSLDPEIGSSMVVPMKVERGKVIGVLSIRRRRPTPDFDLDALRLFSVFASQAALAITNVQLYQDLRARLIELSNISSLTQKVISTLDLNSVLELVANNIIEVVNFDRCCIYLQDRQSGKFAPRIIRGYKPEVIGPSAVKVGEGVVGIVAKTHVPILENDAKTARQPLKGFARALGTSAFVAVPIVSKGNCIGVIVADNKTSGATVTEANIALLSTFAGQAGLAIENAQLYDDRDQRYREMNRLATQTDNILRSIASSVLVVDASGQIVRWNKAFEEMWGLPESEGTSLTYAGLLTRIILPSDESAHLKKLMEEVIAMGDPRQLYKLVLHPKKRPEVIVNVLISPLIDREGRRLGVVQTMEDVTREIQMETEMARMRRLADIGQLAAKIAHEVRNPLSSIKGAAQLMRSEYEEVAPLREFLDIIVDEVNGLSGITSELLEFARPIKMEPAWYRIEDSIEKTVQFLASDFAEHNVRVCFLRNSGNRELYGDARQIEQVIRNLLLNAVQAMPGGGEIRIEASFDPKRHTVSIAVHDTGIGIPKDKLDEVFLPFVTSKTKGTGLGLAIVRKIIENHGGQISVESVHRHGSTFTVAIPIRPPALDLAEGLKRDRRPMPAAMPEV